MGAGSNGQILLAPGTDEIGGRPIAVEDNLGQKDFVERTYSKLSQEAMNELRKCSLDLDSLEIRAEEVLRKLDAKALTFGQAKSELAKVEAQAKKLECDRVDGIYTSGLTTGKPVAKREKKAQLARISQLLDRLDAVFQYINEVGYQH